MSDNIDPQSIEAGCMADLSRLRQEELPLSKVEKKGISYAPNRKNGTAHINPKRKAEMSKNWSNAVFDDDEARQMRGLRNEDARPWASKDPNQSQGYAHDDLALCEGTRPAKMAKKNEPAIVSKENVPLASPSMERVPFRPADPAFKKEVQKLTEADRKPREHNWSARKTKDLKDSLQPSLPGASSRPALAAKRTGPIAETPQKDGNHRAEAPQTESMTPGVPAVLKLTMMEPPKLLSGHPDMQCLAYGQGNFKRDVADAKFLIASIKMVLDSKKLKAFLLLERIGKTNWIDVEDLQVPEITDGFCTLVRPGRTLYVQFENLKETDLFRERLHQLQMAVETPRSQHGQQKADTTSCNAAGSSSRDTATAKEVKAPGFSSGKKTSQGADVLIQMDDFEEVPGLMSPWYEMTGKKLLSTISNLRNILGNTRGDQQASVLELEREVLKFCKQELNITPYEVQLIDHIEPAVRHLVELGMAMNRRGTEVTFQVSNQEPDGRIQYKPLDLEKLRDHAVVQHGLVKQTEFPVKLPSSMVSAKPMSAATEQLAGLKMECLDAPGVPGTEDQEVLSGSGSRATGLASSRWAKNLPEDTFVFSGYSKKGLGSSRYATKPARFEGIFPNIEV